MLKKFVHKILVCSRDFTFLIQHREDTDTIERQEFQTTSIIFKSNMTNIKTFFLTLTKILLEDEEELEGMMDAEAYSAHIAEEADQ